MVDRLTRRILALASVLCVTGVTAARAEDGMQCLPLKAMLAGLAAQYHELPVASGMLASGKGMVVLTASPHGETYSVLLIIPGATPDADATACALVDGANWEAVKPVAPEAAPNAGRPAKPRPPRRMVTPVPDESI